jgi:hypothetical protein
MKIKEIHLINVHIEGLKQRLASAVEKIRQDRYAQGITAKNETLEVLSFKIY